MCIVHSNHSMVLNEEHTLCRVWAKWHGWESHNCLVTTLSTMHDVLRTTSLSMLNQQTGASVSRELQWDDVHFECRFVKPLWSIIAQANILTVSDIDTTNTSGISWRHTVPTTIQKKEGHVVWHATQCCVHTGMSDMGALQRHHHQSHSTFWTTCLMQKWLDGGG